MSEKGLGAEVAVGLVAGPADFERLRATLGTEPVASLWRRFEGGIESALSRNGGTAPAGLALAACVRKNHDWAGRAVADALNLAALPMTHWVHREAGCMSLEGVHNVENLALAVDWLWPVLNRAQREALLGALVAKSVENLTAMPCGIRDHKDGRGQLLFVRRLDPSDPHCLHPLPHGGRPRVGSAGCAGG